MLQVLFVPLMYLGWGRGGLLGEGSSVVGLGGNYVPWSTPGDLCHTCILSDNDILYFCTVRHHSVTLSALVITQYILSVNLWSVRYPSVTLSQCQQQPPQNNLYLPNLYTFLYLCDTLSHWNTVKLFELASTNILTMSRCPFKYFKYSHNVQLTF